MYLVNITIVNLVTRLSHIQFSRKMRVYQCWSLISVSSFVICSRCNRLYNV